MNAPAQPAPSGSAPRPSRRWRVGILLLGLYFVPACGIAFASGGQYGFLMGLPFLMLLGVFSYPARVLPDVTIDWWSVATFVVTLGCLCFAAHSLCAGAARTLGAGRPWRLRLTLTLMGVVFALFLAAMAVAGIGHQAGWLWATPERLTDNPWETSPCPFRRSTAWFERWRVYPLDGETPLTSRRFIVVPRHGADAELIDPRPRLCDRESGNHLEGHPVDDAEVSRLLRIWAPNDALIPPP
jgi:hypothetical protein